MEQDESKALNSLDYANWTQHYSMLNKKWREDPMDALMTMATMQSLFEVRQTLWLVMTATMKSVTLEDDQAEEKGEMIFFFETLHEIFELVYRVRQLVVEKTLTYQYVKP